MFIHGIYALWFLNIWNCLYSNTAATILEAKSLIGILHQIPAAPIKVGKMNRHGKRNNNCLVSERKIALFAIPILWKKLDVTIWKPTIGNSKTTIRKPSAARLMRPSSLVNNETTISQKNAEMV